MSPRTSSTEAFFREFEGDPAYGRERAIARAHTNFAVNVNRLRRAGGLTQQELAARAGMRQPRIAEIEAGEYNPRLDTVAKMAHALGVEPADLLAAPEPAVAVDEDGAEGAGARREAASAA